MQFLLRLAAARPTSTCWLCGGVRVWSRAARHHRSRGYDRRRPSGDLGCERPRLGGRDGPRQRARSHDRQLHRSDRSFGAPQPASNFWTTTPPAATSEGISRESTMKQQTHFVASS